MLGYTTHLIYTIIFVVVFFGFCIIIHELGHFLAAKWRKLHIVAFSIGFKTIWRMERGGVEYRIGCLPFGGYVDLPQIDASGPATTKDGAPLPPAKPLDRIIVAFAGPLFNILFGFALATVLWLHGIPQDTPKMSWLTVKNVEPGSNEHKAGLRDGDKIVKINDERFNSTWLDLVQEFLFAEGDIALTVVRDDGEHRLVYAPAVNPKNPRLAAEGLPYPFFEPDIPVKARVESGSDAWRAGLRDHDRILKIDGETIFDHADMARAIQDSEGRPMTLEVERQGKTLTLKDIRTTAVEKEKFYSDGVTFEPRAEALQVTAVSPNSAAAAAGFAPDDMPRSIDGKKLEYLSDFPAIVAAAKDKPLDYEIERGGRPMTLKNVSARYNKSLNRYLVGVTFTGEQAKKAFPLKVISVDKNGAAEQAGIRVGDKITAIDGTTAIPVETYLASVRNGQGKPVTFSLDRNGQALTATLTPKMFLPYRLAGLSYVFYAYPTPWEQFTKVITLTIRTIRGIFSKESRISVKHMSGPVGIVSVIGQAVYKGSAIIALNFIVIITFSLGLFNLIPFPILDGGHILLAVIELIARRPLPAFLVQPVSMAFVALLIFLMIFVTYNDIDRLANKSISRFFSAAAHKARGGRTAAQPTQTRSASHDTLPSPATPDTSR